MRKILILALGTLSALSLSHEIDFISCYYKDNTFSTPWSEQIYSWSGNGGGDFFEEVSGAYAMAGAGAHAVIHASSVGAAETTHNAYFEYTFEWIPLSRSDVPDYESTYTLQGNRSHKTFVDVDNTVMELWLGPGKEWLLYGGVSIVGDGGPHGGDATLQDPDMHSEYKDAAPSGVDYSSTLSSGGTWVSDTSGGTIGTVVFFPAVGGHIYGKASVLITESALASTAGSTNITMGPVTGAQGAQTGRVIPTTLAGVTILGT
jgi:hypothetical protein